MVVGQIDRNLVRQIDRNAFRQMDGQKDKFLVLISELDLVKMFGKDTLGKITSLPSSKKGFYVRYLQIFHFLPLLKSFQLKSGFRIHKIMRGKNPCSIAQF